MHPAAPRISPMYFRLASLIAPPFPQKPHLVSPANATAINTDSAVFVWHKGSPLIDRYSREIANDSLMTAIISADSSIHRYYGSVFKGLTSGTRIGGVSRRTTAAVGVSTAHLSSLRSLLPQWFFRNPAFPLYTVRQPGYILFLANPQSLHPAVHLQGKCSSHCAILFSHPVLTISNPDWPVKRILCPRVSCGRS